MRVFACVVSSLAFDEFVHMHLRNKCCTDSRPHYLAVGGEFGSLAAGGIPDRQGILEFSRHSII